MRRDPTSVPTGARIGVAPPEDPSEEVLAGIERVGNRLRALETDRRDLERRLERAEHRASEVDRARLAATLGKAQRALAVLRRERDDQAAALGSAARDFVRLRDEVEGKYGIEAESDVVEGGLGGRRAIEHYRNVTVRRFLKHLNDLGLAGQGMGEEHATWAIGASLLADLQVAYSAAPLTVEEAERRALLEEILANPSFSRALTGHRLENAYWRDIVRKLFARSGVPESTWDLSRRSIEEEGTRPATPRDE